MIDFCDRSTGPLSATRDCLHKRTVVPSSYEVCREVQAELLSTAEAFGYDDDHLFALRLATEEAVVNAIKHGNRQDPSCKVTIEYQVGRTETRVKVEDQGDGFDPDDVADPLAEENLHRANGRGIALMRCYMTSVRFTPPGNAVEMRLRRG